MGRAARDLGYEYVAICDHTRNVRVVPGLDADDLRSQAEEIAAANEELAPFRVLRGTEVDIRGDGSLDLPDDVLDELDWVQLSLHAGQREAREPLTQKVIEAMRHPAVTCLSHPHGRIINHRPPNALDLEAVIETALETGVALETNGLPDRLDLAAPQIRLAIEAGVPIVASTDAHSIRGLGNMRLAIATARRGWATAADIVNTRPSPAAPTRFRSERDDDLPSSVSLFEIRDGLRDVAERIGPVDDRRDLASFDELDRVSISWVVSLVRNGRSRWRTTGDETSARTTRSIPANRPSPLLSTSVPVGVSARLQAAGEAVPASWKITS